MLKYYKFLPDYMSVDELQKLFINFLNKVKYNEFVLEEALESLMELSDRQWHTYELLNKNIMIDIENWLISVIRYDSEIIIEYITSIIGLLGLEMLYTVVKDSLKSDLSKKVRQVIEETVKEIDGHVKDPYYGMKC